MILVLVSTHLNIVNTVKMEQLGSEVVRINIEEDLWKLLEPATRNIEICHLRLCGSDFTDINPVFHFESSEC